jgi:(4S)-4-hydroxy-5-phosphonooxypentane-2,3-dione isomerase
MKRRSRSKMYVVCVTVHVKPENGQDFVDATAENARHTRQEPGNARFDLLRGEDDDNRFFLYEVYRSKEDFVAHQQTPHYSKWREAVKDWMAQPRQGVRYESILPLDADWG